jgi:hypothetical protein
MSVKKGPVIGISVGDLNGIGIELILKTFADNRISEFCTPIIFGSNKILNHYRKLMPEININYNNIKEINKANPNILGRDQQWFKTWSQAGKKEENYLQPALDLIKKWEGLRLEGYICPAGVPTVGYGHTGPTVKEDMKITEADAEALLLSDVEQGCFHFFEIYMAGL